MPLQALRSFGQIDQSAALNEEQNRSRSLRRSLVGERQAPSNPDPLCLVDVNLIAGAPIELGRPRRFVVDDLGTSDDAPLAW